MQRKYLRREKERHLKFSAWRRERALVLRSVEWGVLRPYHELTVAEEGGHERLSEGLGHHSGTASSINQLTTSLHPSLPRSCWLPDLTPLKLNPFPEQRHSHSATSETQTLFWVCFGLFTCCWLQSQPWLPPLLWTELWRSAEQERKWLFLPTWAFRYKSVGLWDSPHWAIWDLLCSLVPETSRSCWDPLLVISTDVDLVACVLV